MCYVAALCVGVICLCYLEVCGVCVYVIGRCYLYMLFEDGVFICYLDMVC